MLASKASLSGSHLTFMPTKGERGYSLALTLLLIMPIVFGVIAVALGQDANWDLRNYHWYNAYALLNGRFGADWLPSQTPWFYNPALDVPYYILATHVPARVAAFALGIVQGLNFIPLFMLAHASLRVPNPRHKIWICAALAMLGMLGGGGIALLGTTFYDNVTSLGIFASALLVLRYAPEFLGQTAFQSIERHANDSSKQTKKTTQFIVTLRALGLALLCGIPAGIMMGLKLPSVVFCVGLCGAIFLAGGPFAKRVTASAAFGLGVLIGVAISLGPWALHLQKEFGSPLFPYFNEIFRSPLAPLTSARDTQFVPNKIYDYLAFPFILIDHPRRAGEIDWRDLRLPVLYILLPVAVCARLAFGRSKAKPDNMAEPYAMRFLLWLAVLSYAVWLVMFSIYRYAVPLEMLAPLLIALTTSMLPVKTGTRSQIALFLLVVIAATIQPGDWRHRKEWLDRVVEADIPPIENSGKAMILMAGFEPYSHLVTQFPQDAKFVRIQSNFASPDQDKGINKILHKAVESHKGDYLILIPPYQHGLAQEALSYYKLSASWKDCRKVIDKLYDNAEFHLCPVRRVTIKR